MSSVSFKPAGYARKANRFAVLAALSIAAITGLWLAGVPSGHASDLDVSVADQASGAHFLRIGLNKSVVIRLPAEAKDVLVGNPDIVDAVVRTKNTAYLFARAIGQTNIFFFDGSGQQILNLDLEVAQDTTAIQKLIKRTLPGSRITVDTVGNSVVLGGVAANAAEAKTAEDLAKKFGGDVLNTIKLAGDDQVILKVRIAEVQRDVMKQLGVDLSKTALTLGKFAFGIDGMYPFTNGYSGAVLSSSYDGKKFDINAAVAALEGNGLMRTLAEPTLTAISGQGAQFHAGGEYPYTVCDASAAVRQCTVEFKKYGVQLDFTPVVLNEGRINMKIHTEVSELASISGAGVPVINTRNAETTLEMPSGGSMMLAGLIKDSVRQNLNGAPGLKQLPVLGALFRSRDYVQNETELVVLVTPYIVGPTSEKQMTLPTDRLNPATEKDQLLFGRLNKIYGAPGSQADPSAAYTGSVGHIIE